MLDIKVNIGVGFSIAVQGRFDMEREYEVLHKEPGSTWQSVERERAERILAENYRNPSFLTSFLEQPDGVNTPFSFYRFKQGDPK